MSSSDSESDSEKRHRHREPEREENRRKEVPDRKREARERDNDENREKSRSERQQRDRERERERESSRDRERRRERDSSRDRERKRNRDSSRDRERRRERDDRERDQRRRRDRDDDRDNEQKDDKAVDKGNAGGDDENYMKAKRQRLEGDESIMTRTGGAYIPPARLRMMQAQITDKQSVQFQRLAWEALKKSIHGLINKVNVSNISFIVRELFQENIVRGRGLVVKSILQAQGSSQTFTHVFAGLVSIINTKFPQIGELLMKRLILNFKKGFRRNDKVICLSSVRFIAHLVNQQVCHEILALEILTLLLENPTDDSVEVAVAFLKECGMKLTEISPRGIHAIFERLRTVLHEANIDKRVQYMIEVMFAVRKDGFKEFPSVLQELDLIEDGDQITHMMTLEDAVTGEEQLNVFKFDPEYEEGEQKYSELKKAILDEDSGAEDGEGSDEDESGEESGGEEAKTVIVDQTETNLVALRRTIYLTIQSSLDFEECAHKLLKLQLKPGQEVELCNMILDSCAQQRTYEKFFGLLAQRFCMLDRKYIAPFTAMFKEQFETIHRLETNKLRNIAKFFAHLLHSDAISFEVLSNIKLNEDDTTSSSRIFIKILFQELVEYMGLAKLNTRLKDPTLLPFFEGVFPRDNPKNTRFAINFFTCIGLGGLTDDLRNHLKNAPKPAPIKAEETAAAEVSSSSSDDSSSSSSSSSSSDDSSSSDEDSNKRHERREKKVSRRKR